MNILCLDHVCHTKTKSFDFFLGLLRESGHEVEVFYYEHHYQVKPPKEKIDWADAVFYLEFLPSRFRLLFPGKRIVYVPMYDNEWGSKWQWRRIAWSGMGVISFSKRVSDHARRCGVKNLLEVMYFPNPSDFPQVKGEPKRVFLWERGDIDRKTAEILFPPSEGYVFDVKKRDEFLERGEYLERLSRCEIVIAPRKKEGIGMAFLEAMAMGKCVAAHNDATMNEYIEDGVTGVLFDAMVPTRVAYEKVTAIGDGIMGKASELHMRWQCDKNRIADFASNRDVFKPGIVNKLKLMMAFPMVIGEWIRFRITR